MTSPDERRPDEPRDREVVVTETSSGTNYAGIIVAILAIIVFGVLGWMFIGAMSDDGGEVGVDPVPEEMDVDVETGES